MGVLHTAVAEELPFSGSLEINSLHHFLSEPVYSVLNSSLISAFFERAWRSSVLTVGEEGLGETGQRVEFWLRHFPALGPGYLLRPFPLSENGENTPCLIGLYGE